MNVLSRRLGLLVAAAGAVLSLSAITAPVASAAPVPAPAAPPPPPAYRPPPLQCRPAHVGRMWRWEEQRRWSHWDHLEWSPRTRQWVWRSYWLDNRYCAPNRFGGPPARPVGNPPPPPPPNGNGTPPPPPNGNGTPPPPAAGNGPPPPRGGVQVGVSGSVS